MTEPIAHLYVNTPFCRGVCGFCNFYKTDTRTYQRFFGGDGSFGSLLRDDLKKRPVTLAPRPLSVYIGGGSPMELGDSSLRAFLAHLHRHHELHKAEITLEANPFFPTDRELLESPLYNRLSVGIQSFSERALSILHRPKIPDMAFLSWSRQHIKNLSLDLIYDIPGHSDEGFRDDVKKALDLSPDHLSFYSLEVTNDVFRKKIGEGDPDAFQRQFSFLEERLGRAGYQRYEISNWCRPGFQSIHNRAYWETKPYLGLGPAAWSAYHDGGSWVRLLNHQHPGKWQAALLAGLAPIQERDPLDPGKLRNEFVFLSLRRAEGIDLAEFERRFGEPFEASAGGALSRLEGCFLRENGHLRLSPRGVLYYNHVCADLMRVE